MKKKQAIGLCYLAPVLILIIVFFLYPSFSIIKTSFYQTRYGIHFNFAGLKNYRIIFGDEVFHASLVNSLIWTISGLILQMTIPLGTALLLNQRFRGNTFARAAMLVPWITPGVIIAIMARWILEPELGMLNSILLKIGIIHDPINFLGSSTAALPTLIIAQTWQFIPFGTLLILAALQTISQSLYDAMKVDGATPLKIFRYLIVPKISPMIGFMLFLAFVWNFNVFDKIWLTTQGGPVNATMTLPVLVYKTAFKTFRLGQSSAVGTITVVGLIIVGIIYFKYMWKPIKQE